MAHSDMFETIYNALKVSEVPSAVSAGLSLPEIEKNDPNQKNSHKNDTCPEKMNFVQV